jgi:hypothetical protein
MPTPYFSGSPEKWAAIEKLQKLKRRETRAIGADALRSDQAVMINPVTKQEVPLADLQYASKHLREIYESGMIREDRWAFLWYH